MQSLHDQTAALIRLVRAAGAVITASLAFAAPAQAEGHVLPEDESWITLNGTVESVAADSFVLDYGEGLVTIEMDDGDRDADGYKLVRGDRVAVTGRVDKGLFESTSIEAAAVYVKNINTMFFSSSVDDEEWGIFTDSFARPLPAPGTSVVGEVTAIGENGITVNWGLKSMHVDISQLSYDPLDDSGYQKIDVGDVVRVIGKVERDRAADLEITASSLIELKTS